MAVFETSNLRIERTGETSAQLLLDVADKSVNVFNQKVFADLEAALDYIKADLAIQVVFISSAKLSKQIAGADLNEFTKISSPEEAKALSALGQRVFGKLADLPATTIIVVQGSCLGGGLEFALACDYRLLIDHPKTQLGLPEVELGIIPGWGGTQRLPRRVGLERALQVILGGKRLSARDAQRWGLADGVAKGEKDLVSTLKKLGDIAMQRGKQPCRGLPKRTWRQRVLESNPFGRYLIFRGAERIMKRKVPDDMPAPAVALEAVRTGLSQGMEAGFACEREAGAKLLSTTASRNLVWLFFQREQARKAPVGAVDAVVKRVGIVGAGTMGAGIAQLASVRGFEVIVQEVDQAALASGMNRIADLFEKAVERGVLSRDEADLKLARFGRTTTWEGFGDVDLVVEAVLEDLPLKQKVFRELEARCGPETLLATNTSSLVVKGMQEGLAHPERVAGLHFFNPVHKLPLVEVVRGPATNDASAEKARSWAAALGKTPVIVKDSPGFVVNRVLMPYLDEAVRLVREGVEIEDVDRAMRRFGMPMGPLELLDQIGIDVAAHVARSLPKEHTTRFPPSPAFERMVEKGWLGVKKDIGFYKYNKKKLGNIELLPLIRDVPESLLASLPVDVQIRECRERMVLLMLNEASACLAEGLADADTIDLAMVMGTGWAPHRGGPLHYLRERGEGEVAKTLRSLAERLGPRFEPCGALKQING
jgi:3-hydroxyacyl-CoA dehydrogenase/enoyl-CoA hydratase/3-hydroxybutyryl-CoA epimerase